MRFRTKRHNNNIPRIDTSKEGFAKVGIKLTQKQFEDLCAINLAALSENYKGIPVFTIMLVLRTMGLIPTEFPEDKPTNDGNNQTDDNIPDEIHRLLGYYKK